MTAEEKYAEADRLEKQATKLRKEAGEMRRQDMLQKPLLERLVFSAHARCECGAGLAYDPAGEVGKIEGSPFRGPDCWDCSDILLGHAIPKGETGSKKHTDKLPFSMYEIKSERQPSAGGATTRPSSGSSK